MTTFLTCIFTLLTTSKGEHVGILDKFFGGLASDILDNFITDNRFESISSILSLTGSESGANMSVFWGYVQSIINITKPIGIALIVTFFLMYLYSSASREQITVESLVKVLIQLTIIVAVMSNLEKIINAILSASESILKSLESTNLSTVINKSSTIRDKYSVNGQYSSSDSDAIIDEWLASGDWGITIVLKCLILQFISWLSLVAIQFAAIARMLELGWRVAFAPIGIANCFNDTGNIAETPAVRYLKGIAGCALAGAVIFAISAIGTSLAIGIASSSEFGTILLSAVTYLATAGACIGASNKVKEIVGG